MLTELTPVLEEGSLERISPHRKLVRSSVGLFLPNKELRSGRKLCHHCGATRVELEVGIGHSL
jgi:hypothetical protein